MGNFSQQTGDSREAKLLCEIGKAIDKLTKVLSVTVTYTTTAHP